jgi:DNA-binding NarL/FixJ family response regulator
MMMTVRSPNLIDVVLADDSEHFRRGMEAVLATDDRLNVVGVASDGEELLDIVSRTAPDVAVVDLRMPRVDGVAATRSIRTISPVTKVLILTVSDEDEDLLAAIVAGAHGYLLKETAIDDIPDAIVEVTVGGAPLSPPMAAALWREYSDLRAAGVTPVLPSRQERALCLLSQGVDAGQIAAGLGVERTVVEHDLFDAFEKVRLVGGLRALHV